MNKGGWRNLRGLLTLAGLVWAAVMLAATLLLDDKGPVLPFWLLLIAYYITISRNSVDKS